MTIASLGGCADTDQVDSTSDPGARARRRTFTAEYKARVLDEYDALPVGSSERGALLRREALYSSHIAEWRKARDAGARAGLAPKGKAKRTAEQVELDKLRRRTKALEAELHRTKLALEITGKSTRALGDVLRERGFRGEVDAVIAAQLPGLEAVTSTKRACELLGASRATLYRRRNPRPRLAARARPEPPNKLTEAERQRILTVLRSKEYCDLAPAQVWAHLLDDGVYLCSIRTMDRLLAIAGENRERRRQRTHPARKKPELIATAPNRVWSWDITKLQGPQRGVYYHLYVIIDIFSRYIPGWTIAAAEAGELAKEFIADTLARQGITRGQLALHADRGTSMTSKPVSQLLIDLGVDRSHSRPHVSNDNPYSEANFKTLKYCPAFPGRFGSLEDARAFCTRFFDYYNHEHRHSGVSLHTPASVHYGTATQIHAQRAATLDAAYTANPARFRHRRPTPPKLPTIAWINQPNSEALIKSK
ncbi:IS3 family transposase [Mycobacterium sp.]|uniref:IS3 family transposase n=1 Tax=Mycobacterium sp. TaxID=1785 RepID=UPI003A8ADF10